MRKKGFNIINELGVIIVIIIAAIAIMAIAKVYFSQDFEGKGCRDALKLTHDVKLRFSEYTPVPWPSQCITTRESIQKSNKENVQEDIALLMKDCWYKVHEGTLDPFRSKLWTTEKPCYECYVFTAPELSEKIDKEDFESFLSTQEVNPRVSYTQYFQVEGTKGQPGYILDDIESNKGYSIIYADSEFNIISKLLGYKESDTITIIESNKVEGSCYG